MNDENSTTGAATSRITFTTLEINVQNSKAVIRTVPTSASKAAFFIVMM